MFARSWFLLTLFVLSFAMATEPARAQDFQICLNAADKVTDGDKLKETEKQAAHEACQRALADTSSVVQKYQLQEADFDIMGHPAQKQN